MLIFRKKRTVVPDPLPLAYSLCAFINVDNCERPLTQLHYQHFLLMQSFMLTHPNIKVKNETADTCNIMSTIILKNITPQTPTDDTDRLVIPLLCREVFDNIP